MCLSFICRYVVCDVILLNGKVLYTLYTHTKVYQSRFIDKQLIYAFHSFFLSFWITHAILKKIFCLMLFLTLPFLYALMSLFPRYVNSIQMTSSPLHNLLSVLFQPIHGKYNLITYSPNTSIVSKCHTLNCLLIIFLIKLHIQLTKLHCLE